MPVPATPAAEEAPAIEQLALEVVETELAPAPVTAEVEAAEAPEPTVLQRAQAMLKPKANIQAEASHAKKLLAQANDQVALLTGQLAEITERSSQLTTDYNALADVVAQLESEAMTVTDAATDMVAAAGVPASELPAQEVEAPDFAAELAAAQQAGGATLTAFIREHRSEVNAQLARK